jgi:expansin (peptidoglycan-binding protein)
MMRTVRAICVLVGLAACGGGGPGNPLPPGEPCGAATARSGEGTYYAADGSGACGFPAQGGGPLLVAAMNAPDWTGSGVCGMCAEVTGPLGKVTVRIVDLCPECKTGDLDLSPEAFDRIAVHAAGRVPITWTEVPCATRGPLVYHFKDGSNQWWTAVQLRDHRHRIASLAVQQGGAWTDIERLDYNYFVIENLGPGPYSLKVTDVHGHEVVDDGVPLLDDADTSSTAQLDACE